MPQGDHRTTHPTENPQSMTKEEKNVRLAEIQGVKCRRCKGQGSYLRHGPHEWYRIGYGKDQQRTPCDHITHDQYKPYGDLLPDYCNDLNAVHDIEETLTDEQYERYSVDLWSIVNHAQIRQPSHPTRCERTFMSASAEQRTDALILTLSQA